MLILSNLSRRFFRNTDQPGFADKVAMLLKAFGAYEVRCQDIPFVQGNVIKVFVRCETGLEKLWRKPLLDSPSDAFCDELAIILSVCADAINVIESRKHCLKPPIQASVYLRSRDPAVTRTAVT